MMSFRCSASARALMSTLALAATLVAGGCANLEPPIAAEAQTLPPPNATPNEMPTAAIDSAAVASAAAAAAPLSEPLEELITVNPLQPRSRLDLAQDAERGDLWQRVRSGFTLADLNNDLVRKWEQWYARDAAYVQRMTERGGRYLFYIVEEIQRRGMPGELALLPFIESAYNPQAMSHASASGMWQFMPATGKDFELHQNLFRDDRRDVLASTRAALDYLQRLHGMFNDWSLALAAYNWGQGNVMRAIERNRREGLATDYQSLRMPQETRDYVPKLQAVENIVMRPDAFALSLQPLENHPFFLSVSIERDIDVALAAALSGLPLEDFKHLNPQMNKPVILAAGTPQVLLPYDNANRFVRELGKHRGALASWTAWVAPRTLKPADAARLIGIDEDQLREVNRIPPRMLVKQGSTLVVPRGAHATSDVAEHIANYAMTAFAPETKPLRRVSVKAGARGESVAAMAQRYRVSAAQLALWNEVSVKDRFKASESVMLLLPMARPGAGRAAATPDKETKAAKGAKATPAGRSFNKAAPRKRASSQSAPR